MIYPRQSNSMSSMGMSSMDMSMGGMSMSMTSSGMGSSPTMNMNSNNTSNGGIKLSPAIIAILAVIGGAVVSIFIGFWIHARLREYRLKNRPYPSQQVASASLSVSTYVGAPSKTGGTLATGSYSRIDQALAPPMPAEYDEKQPATLVHSIPTDPARLAPQRLPGKDTATETEVKATVLSPPYMPNPQSAGNSYLEAPMQQTNLSTPIISPPPVNPAARSPPLPYIPPGVMTKPNDSISNPGHDSATLASGRGPSGRSPAPASLRPLPRIPQQLSRTVSLAPSPRPLPLEQKGDSSFLTFDEPLPDTRVNVPQFDVPDAAQRPPDQNINYNGASNSNNNKSVRAVRLMSVIMDYDPELPDELEVKVGDTVRILREYDDGWCVVEHISRSGKRPGAIPRMCLEERSSG